MNSAVDLGAQKDNMPNTVRGPRPGEGAVVGAIHAQSLRADIRLALSRDSSRTLAEIGGTRKEILTQALARIDPDQIGAQWEEAMATPQLGRLLVAQDTDGVCGFVAFALTGTQLLSPQLSGQTPMSPQTQVHARNNLPTQSAQILALSVQPQSQNQGHGSRLLMAASDLAQQLGAGMLQLWIQTKDQAKVRFFTQAGFGPTPIRRKVDLGGAPGEEQLWYATLPGD